MPGTKSSVAPTGAPPSFDKLAAAGAIGFAGVGLVFFFLIVGAFGLDAAALGLLAWASGAIAAWRATKIAGPQQAQGRAL